LGDPKELLKEYQERLRKLELSEHPAKHYLDTIRKIRNLSGDEGGYSREKAKALKDTIPTSGLGSEQSLPYLAGTSFDLLKVPARKLVLAILQQVVLSPRLRKSVEAAAKFWDKRGIVLKKHIPEVKNDYGHLVGGGSIEAIYFYRTEVFLDLLETYKKHEKVFEQAIREGKAHTAEGEGATRMNAGPFVVVNTGGFPSDTVAQKAEMFKEAAERMHRIGLGMVCYGDALVTNRLNANGNVVAFYHIQSDEMFIRADARVGEGVVSTICHELTHRYFYRFMPEDKRKLVRPLYEKISNHVMVDAEYPKIGETVPYGDKLLRVIENDYRRQKIHLEQDRSQLKCIACGQPVEGHQPDAEHRSPIIRREVYTMPLETYYKAHGKAVKSDALHFVTPYAKSGGPDENFPEMVSFYAMGKLSAPMVELLKPLLP